MYYDNDANLEVLKGSTVAVIGYGSQGHAHALNMRDSGINVIVANRPGSDNYKAAVADGFQPVSAADAAAQADVIVLLTPDHAQPEIYYKDIEPHLGAGKALVFSHGFNIHFKQIVPPDNVDVFMVAPKSPGHLRAAHVRGGPRRARPFGRLSGRDGPSQSTRPGVRQSHRLHPGRALSRRLSRKRPRRICSASRRCCAAASAS